MRNPVFSSLPESHMRIEESKDDIDELLASLEAEVWEHHDNIRGLRIAVHRLFAAQADYGNMAR